MSTKRERAGIIARTGPVGGGIKCGGAWADPIGIMLKYPPPKSNLERQRCFRARHPGYNNRYRRRGITPNGGASEVVAATLAAMPAQGEQGVPTIIAQPPTPAEGWLPSGC
ncbi:MAG: hypothetical protein QM770_11465 [Tepidisphaeraceae bacterium]